VTLESDDLEELTSEIRRLIDSNRLFLERVGDEEYDDEEEAEESDPEPEAGADDYEEL
jgi:hypothetical protein